MKLDITKPVKLRNPLEGEEDMTFMVTNYNETMKRCYITPLESEMFIPGEELVSTDEIVNID